MNKILFEHEHVIISQQSPTQRTVMVDGKYYRLKFPYVIFVTWRSYAFYSFFSNIPVRYLDTPVFIPPLPNIHNNGAICIGSENLSGFITKNEIVPTIIDNKSYRYITPNLMKKYHFWCIERFFGSPFDEGELGSEWWVDDIAIEWRRQSRKDEPLNMTWNNPEKLSHFYSLSVKDLYEPHIAERAHSLWEKFGMPFNQDEFFWNMAEKEIIEEFSK